MEEVFLRFPHIGEQVFKQLNNENLTKCREISKSWEEFIDNQKLPWIRLMKKYLSAGLEEDEVFLEDWQSFVKSYNVATLQEIAITIQHFCEPDLDEEYQNLDPLSAAVLSGNIEIVAKLLKNGAWTLDELDYYPLHYAAKEGNIAMYEFLIEKCEDWNPADCDGVTSLHSAAYSGQFEMCQLIISNVKNIKNKNPKTTYAHYLRHDQGGETPLHLAATNGHLEICKLIVENMDEQGDKNPKNNFGNTPLHYAAADGHFEICKLLAEKIVNKNPENNLRKTPAQIADMNGYKSICELFKT